MSQQEPKPKYQSAKSNTKEAVAQTCSVKKVSLEISQISKNTFFYRTPLVAASNTTLTI